MNHPWILYHISTSTQTAKSACRCSMINLPVCGWVGGIQILSTLFTLRTPLQADLLYYDAHPLHTEASVLPVYIAICLCYWYLILSPPLSPKWELLLHVHLNADTWLQKRIAELRHGGRIRHPISNLCIMQEVTLKHHWLLCSTVWACTQISLSLDEESTFASIFDMVCILSETIVC